VDGILDPGWIVVQGESIMYLEMLNEGQSVEGKSQWGIGWMFWP
jgi:hypothetical protein